jgi:hypothetical protein
MERAKVTVIRFKNVFGCDTFAACVRGNRAFQPRGGDNRHEALGSFFEDNLDPLGDVVVDGIEILEARDSAEAETLMGVD